MAESKTVPLVMPGDALAFVPRDLEGVYMQDGKAYAAVVAVAQDGRFIPLKGKYSPVYGDRVIGLVKNERFAGFDCDLNGPYEGLVSSRDTREEFDLGECVLAKVISVSETKEAGLAEPQRLTGGELVEIDAVKIPRLVGRNGALVQLIKQYTNAELTIGQNGRVYIKNGNTALAALAVLKIAKEAHVSGLTVRVEAFLKEESAKVKV
jgi:exosome complex component RRP4